MIDKVQNNFYQGVRAHELTQLMKDNWETIGLEKIKHLVSAMSDCIDASRNSNGRSTCYQVINKSICDFQPIVWNLYLHKKQDLRFLMMHIIYVLVFSSWSLNYERSIFFNRFLKKVPGKYTYSSIGSV